MKIFIFFVLFLFAGEQPQAIIPDMNNNRVQEAGQIVGKWQRCRTYYKNESEEGNIMSNICLTIVFKEKGKGELLSGDKRVSCFRWKIKSDMLIVSGDFLSDEKKYTLNFKGNEEYLELRPQNKSGVEVIHFLSRLPFDAKYDINGGYAKEPH